MDTELPTATLTANDIQVIDQFRRQKSTAVLTIMFTDIKGFTRMTEEHGEAYSNKLRKQHDALVVPVIEKDGSGRVIKHIGDSVMAVFSEPSTAVARAIEVQEKLAQHNRTSEDKIEVRIGLHSGQVTTEDDVNADVFGRHVNRAARVEALADGGQVLVTYTVFDSARGWLNEKSDKPVAWEKHGRYALKGIPEPVEIYEAYNPQTTKPKAPAGSLKAGGLSLGKVAGAALALIAIAAAGTFFAIQLATSKPEVSLVDYGADFAKLWGGKPFTVGGEPGQHIRPLLTPLDSGHYLLYADTSQIVRSFAPFDVKSGKNLLEIRFSRVQLPGMQRRLSFEAGTPNALQESIEETYTSYDKDMNPHENKAKIELGIKAAMDPENAKRAIFTVNWTVTLNGKVISQDVLTDSNMTDDNETRRAPHKVLWSDDFHFYYLSYYMSGSTIDFMIEANFDDYKDK